MVLLKSEVQCEMDKNEFILWLLFLSTQLLLSLFFRSTTTILTIILEKKTHISKFQFKKLIFFSPDVLGTFLYKKSYRSSKMF